MRRKGLTKARPCGKVHRVFAVEKKFAGVRRSRERWSGVLGNARLSGSGIQRFAKRHEAQDLPLRQIRLSCAFGGGILRNTMRRTRAKMESECNCVVANKQLNYPQKTNFSSPPWNVRPR